MYHKGKKYFCGLFFTALLCTVFTQAFAVNDPIQTRPLLGSKDSVRVGYSSSVIDFAQYVRNRDTTIKPWILPGSTHIQNRVSVGIEEDNPILIQTDFSATVVLHIKRYDSSFKLIDEFDSSFNVNYAKAAGAKYDAMQTMLFENSYQTDVSIVSIDTHGTTSWDVTKVLRIDNTLQADRDYLFTCRTSVPGLNVNYDNLNGELTAQWNDPNNGQTEYDLEWAWVDLSALPANITEDNIFSNNATRVTITGTSYNIPLLYEGEGRLFVRVRPAQLRNTGQRVEGEWTWQNAGAPVVFSFIGHRGDLNWQASTSFAEEGKRKTVVQYFDGTLRSRQTVTKDNSTGKTVVAESMYDYQGRPVIQVLPAPTINRIIDYAQNFNKAVNFNGYPKDLYDLVNPGQNICGISAAPMENSTGASKYYSPNNDELNNPATGYNANKFIPNAQQYPFTETRFTPDGRIAAQGGIGPDYQLGGGHETKYLYELPSQEDLDGLFGTDAGIASHYFKNLVKDANGQYSVSYTDMHGRTVATALSGSAPPSLTPLPSQNTRTTTRELLDAETNRVSDNGRSIISSKPLAITLAGNYTFRYRLDPDQLLTTNCQNNPVCYDCLYDLKITITADCNTPGFPVTYPYSNISLNQDYAHPLCNGGKAPGKFDVTLPPTTMPEGQYTVIKELTLSRTAQEAYRETYAASNTCRTFADFYNEIHTVLVAESNCSTTCDQCNASLGGSLAGFRANFVTQSGMQEPLSPQLVIEITAAYNNAKAHCDRLCNTTNDGMDLVRSIRSQMLLDVSPGGQYADIDHTTDRFSIFNPMQAWQEVFPVGKPAYRHPVSYSFNNTASTQFNYLNQFGQTEPQGIPVTTTPAAFAYDFQNSYADQLLPHHPEYGKLKAAMEKLPASYAFEAKLNYLKTWSDMINAVPGSAGRYIAHILEEDPFFGSGVYPAPGAMYYSQMFNKLNSYYSLDYNPSNPPPNCIPPTPPVHYGSASLWQISQALVFCRNSSTAGCESSPQSLCIRNTPVLPAINPSVGCEQDWDKVWQNFRNIYLNERAKLVAQYLASQNTVPDNDILQNHLLRFINPANNTGPGTATVNDPDLAVLFNEAANGDQGAITQAHHMQQLQYAETCEAYAATWITQLSQCDMLRTRWQNETIKNTDLAWLLPRLRDICQKGSDNDHPMGSSSINPNDPTSITQYGLRDFPAVIQQFFHNTGLTPPLNIPLSANCNNYLITVPKPYNGQQVLVNEQVYTTPSKCDCDQITAMHDQYLHANFPGTFSAYLLVNYQTTISENDLNALLNLCSPNPTCVFLAAPVNLPPVLQCHPPGTATADQTCINCSQYAQIKTDFMSTHGVSAPIANPQTQDDRDWNIAFQNFANYRTGFSKSWQDYVAFGTQCDNLQEIPCPDLNAQLIQFYLSPEYQQNPTGGSCVTAFVNFFNNAFHVYRSYDDWMHAFARCGPVPDPCGGKITCQNIEDDINAFYATFGMNVHNQANCMQLFVVFMDGKLHGNYTYQQIETFYHFLCHTKCSLDICSFPNCFLMTRVYNAFLADNPHPWTLHDCRGIFLAYFNNYFHLNPEWNYEQIEAAFSNCYGNSDDLVHCAPDLSKICEPDMSCPSLQYIIQLWNETYPDGPPEDCENKFTDFFNNIMTSNYTWNDIVKIYTRYCGAAPGVCDQAIDCKKLFEFLSYFEAQILPADMTCQEFFLESFNHWFGTDYHTYIEIYDLYKSHCDFILKDCGKPYPPLTCDNLQTCLKSFSSLYPDPASQLKDDCQGVFSRYFNSYFGTDNGTDSLTFEDITQYFKTLCQTGLDVCSSNEVAVLAFSSDFTTKYGGLHVPRGARRQLYTSLYNRRFINQKSRSVDRTDVAKTFDNKLAKRKTNGKEAGASLIVQNYQELAVAVIPAEVKDAIEATPEMVDSLDFNVLLDMKQSYYVLHPDGLPDDCIMDFTSWFNITMKTAYDAKELMNLYNTVVGQGAGNICGNTETAALPVLTLTESPVGPTPIYQPPLLCGLNDPVLHPIHVNPDPCADLDQIAYDAAQVQWQLYTVSIRNDFDLRYYDKCMKAKDMESLTVTGVQSEYHYTLYYYDQAGNLVQTLPPAAVNRNIYPGFLQDVKDARLTGAYMPNLLNDYSLATNYRYNTLNQVVAQKTPDAKESYFFYDRLGRLVVSQNAKQLNEQKYSYTIYDELGRIAEVGQLANSTAITQAISQNPDDANTSGSLINWYTGRSADQITRTFYDKTYFDGAGTLCPQYLCQQNLRNRVSFTALYGTGTPGVTLAGKHTAATFYSYDIHGNVNTLLQDLNFGEMKYINPNLPAGSGPGQLDGAGNLSGNRFKKIQYNYDLISGKVNEVAYQPGAADAFYHKYTYDAENRLTDVETSIDHVVWEKDARYSYYKHGPLARLILGQQQVQGIDYAYTLQGWLKGVNSTAVGDGSFDIGGDGLTGGTNRNVARDVFGLSMNYFGNDYHAIGSGTPFTNLVTQLGTNSNELFNGNIAALSVNIPVLGEAKVYSFKYDQLNRLLNQDVYEGLNNSSNVFNPVAIDAYKERLSYDANGNIITYSRNGQGTGTAAALNNYSYAYQAGSNKLISITNHVPATPVTKTYSYDDIGNTTADGMQGVTNAVWNVYGKLQSLTNKSGENITYGYDASGQRISKTVGTQTENTQTEYYVKDATGNTMATYKKETGINNGHLSAREYYKYGSSLLSIRNMKVDVEGGSTTPPVLVRGDDGYILSDARSNTLAVISDRKLQVADPNNPNNILYYTAEVKTSNYYSSYGAIAKSFGTPPVVAFNGQRKSTEIGDDAQTALYWEYNGDVGRRWNLDPIVKVWESPYECFSGNSIQLSDPLGLTGTDWIGKKNSDGKTYSPVYDPNVHNGSDVKGSDYYIGKDIIIFATDKKYYHLSSDGNAYRLNHPTKRQKQSASPMGPPVPPKGGAEKPDTPTNNPQNTKGPSPSDGTSELPPSPPGLGLGLLDPEFITLNLSSPLQLPSGILPDKLNVPFTGSLQVTNDKYGNVYITPLNATGTNSASTKLSVSLMYYFMLKPSNPSEKDLGSFLTGTSVSITGGDIVGGSVMTNHRFNQWAIGVGYTSPSVSLTISQQPPAWVFPHVGLKWGAVNKKE